MHAPAICLFVCVSAVLSNECRRGFHYSKSVSMLRRTTEEECKLCNAGDCFTITQARCEYNMAAAELQEMVLPEDTEDVDEKFKAQVDMLLFEAVQKASTTDCIPHISQYTDCSKANLCLGCTTCNCDDVGRWDCSQEVFCHADDMVIDHNGLLMAMMALKENKLERRVKRSIELRSKEDNNKISYPKLSEWIYEVEPLKIQREIQEPIRRAATDKTGTFPRQVTPDRNTNEDSNSLGFEEVLNGIAVDTNRTYSKEKFEVIPNSVDNVSFDVDQLLSDESYTTSSEAANVETTTEAMKPTEEVDLIELMKNEMDAETKLINKIREKDYAAYPRNEIKKEINPVNDYGKNGNENNRNNIHKRDLAQVTEENTTREASNITNTFIQLRDNVLYPLNDKVYEKEVELTQLKSIRDSLIQAMKVLNKNVSMDYKAKRTRHNHTLFSIYKLETAPHYDFSIRRVIRPLRADRHLKRLNRDIYQVIRDVVGLQKHNIDLNTLSPELKVMIRSMKRYFLNRYKINNTATHNSLRRHSESYEAIDKIKKVQDNILEILENIEKEMPRSNTMGSLSTKAKSIVYRIIKPYHIDKLDFSTLTVDPVDEITKDLESVGTKWHEISNRIISSPPSERLDNIKLLHLILTVDMHKIKKVLKLMNITQNRRASFQSILINQSSILRINQDIRYIYKKFLESKKRRLGSTVTTQLPLKQQRSFMNRIKQTMIPINDTYLSKKVEFAKKKLKEFTQINMIETLKKWQSDLNVRSKRSSYVHSNLKHSMINSLPLYLRHKLSPAISKKDNNKKKKRTYRRLKNTSKHITTSKATTKHIVTTQGTSHPPNSVPTDTVRSEA